MGTIKPRPSLSGVWLLGPCKVLSLKCVLSSPGQVLVVSSYWVPVKFFPWMCVPSSESPVISPLTCLLQNTNKTASLSSSSCNILCNSSLASFILSLSLLSTTNIKPMQPKKKTKERVKNQYINNIKVRPKFKNCLFPVPDRPLENIFWVICDDFFFLVTGNRDR